jgi:hypothetical protein
MKSLRVFLLVLCATTLAFAGDNEFRGVVHAIEGHYGVRRTHIPLLSFALFFVRPEGVSGMRLAVFENFHGLTEAGDVSRLVESSLGPGWYPFVRVRSKNTGNDGDGSGETTLIYANPSGGKLRMMIVNVEPSEATVVELKLSDHAIKRWLKEPGEEAEAQSGHHRPHADD